MGLIPILLAAVQLGAGLYKQHQESERSDQDYADVVRANKRAAISRSLKNNSYLRSSDSRAPLNTDFANTIGGTAQAAQAFDWEKLGKEKNSGTLKNRY